MIFPVNFPIVGNIGVIRNTNNLKFYQFIKRLSPIDDQ